MQTKTCKTRPNLVPLVIRSHMSDESDTNPFFLPFFFHPSLPLPPPFDGPIKVWPWFSDTLIAKKGGGHGDFGQQKEPRRARHECPTCVQRILFFLDYCYRNEFSFTDFCHRKNGHSNRIYRRQKERMLWRFNLRANPHMPT